MVPGAAQLPQLPPVGEGGKEGTALLAGDELKLDGGVLLQCSLAGDSGGRRGGEDHRREQMGLGHELPQRPVLVGGRVLPVEGGEGFRQTGIHDGLCDINHGGDLLVCHG